MAIKEFIIESQILSESSVLTNYDPASASSEIESEAKLRVRLPTAVTIDFSQLNLNLPANEEISLSMPEGFFQEQYGGSNQTVIPAQENFFTFSIPLALLESSFNLTGNLTTLYNIDKLLNSNFTLTAEIGVIKQTSSSNAIVSSINTVATKFALDFTFSDSQFVGFQSQGTRKIVTQGSKVITSENLGPNEPALTREIEFKIFDTDINGNISFDTSFIIDSSDENSGYEPNSPALVKLEEYNNEYFFAQSNDVDDDFTTGDFLSYTSRIWKNTGTNSWNVIFDLLGTDTESYEIVDYYIQKATGNHYLLILYKQDANGDFVIPDTRELRMYTSLNNGTTWFNSFSENTFIDFQTSEGYNKFAINEDYFAEFVSTSIVLRNLDSGADEHFIPQTAGYNDTMAAYDNILVTAGENGHIVYDTSSLTELATLNYSLLQSVLTVTNSFLVTGATSTQFSSNVAVYRLFGDFGRVTTIINDGSFQNYFRDADISLGGLAIMQQNTFRFYK